MSLTRNLIFAEMAVKHVERFLRGRASNKPEDIVHTVQQNLRARFGNDKDRMSDELSNGFALGMKMEEIYQNRVSLINDERDARRSAGNRLNAAAIIASGVGNCFEHAVLACHFLKGKGVPCYMVDTDEDTDHVFVVIGVATGLNGQTFQAPPNAAPPPPLSTGNSVVCDPWYHEWFGIQQSWPTKMNRILSTTNKRSGSLPSTIPLTLTDGALVT